MKKENPFKLFFIGAIIASIFSLFSGKKDKKERKEYIPKSSDKQEITYDPDPKPNGEEGDSFKYTGDTWEGMKEDYPSEDGMG